MSELNRLTKANTIRRYLREIIFTKDVLLLEIQQTVKATEFEEGMLIEELTSKFYGSVTDAIMVIHKKLSQYRVDIESSMSLFEEALELQDDISTETNELSVLLQTAHDEANIVLNDIDLEVQYLRNKIK